MPDKKLKLYETLKGKGLYSKSFEDFSSQFSEPDKIEKLYQGLSKKGLYTKSGSEFNDQFFSDVKKKVSSEGLDSGEEISSTPSPVSQDKPVLNPNLGLFKGKNAGIGSSLTGGDNPFDINPKAKPTTPGLENAMSAFAGAQGQGTANKINELSNNKPQDQVSIDTENVGGRGQYVGNKLLQGIGSLASGLVDLGLNAGKTQPFGGMGVVANDAVIGSYRKNVAPKVRDYLKDNIGFEVDKGAEATYDNEFITSSIGGLAQSMPAMLTGRPGMLLQAFDSGLQAINNSDPDGLLDEETKTIYASGLGLVQSTLEKVGLDKIMQGNTTILSKLLFDKAVREATQKTAGKVTGDVLELYINNNVKGITALFAKGGARAVEGFLTEATTGGTQEVAAIGSEFLLNKATGKPIFDTSKEQTWDGFIKRVSYAAGQEGVGGFIMGPFFGGERKAKVKQAQNRVLAITGQLDNPNLSPPAVEALTKRKIELHDEMEAEAALEVEDQKLLPPASLKRATEIDDQLNNLEVALSDPELADELRPEIQAQIDGLNAELDQITSQPVVDTSSFKKNDLVNYTDADGNVIQVPVESVNGNQVKIGINKDGIYSSIDVPAGQISPLNAPVIQNEESNTAIIPEISNDVADIEERRKNELIEDLQPLNFPTGNEQSLSKEEFDKIYNQRLEKYNNRDALNKKINAKYDAELQALEKANTNQVAPKAVVEGSKKTLKQLEAENKSTLPKVPTVNVFSNSIEQPSREDRVGIDSLIDEKNPENDKTSDLPVESVDVSSVIPTQKNLTVTNLEDVKLIKEKPLLLKVGDKYFVIDGHHRIANQILNGESKIDAHVFSQDNKQGSTDNEAKKTVLPEPAPQAEKAKSTPPVNEKVADQQVGNPEYQSRPQSKGRSTYIRTPDGDKIEGTYKVVSSDDVLASHNENTFSQTENFPTTESGTTVNDRDYSKDRNAQGQVVDIASNFDSRAINDTPVVDGNGIVISGNNRTMSRKLAATNQTDGTYLEELNDKAEMYGIDPETIKGIKNPMLVFEPKTNMPYTTETFAKFNKATGKEKGPIEKAVEIAKTITDKARRQIASVYENATKASDITSDAKNAKELKDVLLANKIIDQKELPRYYDVNKNVFTKEGVSFLENLLMGGSLNESSLRALDAESMGDIRRKIIGAVVQLTRNSSLGANSLAENISKAIEIANKLKKTGLSLQDYVAQGNIFEKNEMSEEDFMVASALINEPGFKEFLQNYNDNVGAMDMFTGKERDKSALTDDYIDQKYGKSADQIRKNLAGNDTESKGEVRKDASNVQETKSKAPEGKPKEVENALNDVASASFEEQISKVNDLIKAQEAKIKQAISNMAGISDRAKVAKVMDPLNAEYNRLKQVKKDLESSQKNGNSQSGDQDAKVFINSLNPLSDLMGVTNQGQEKYIAENTRKVEDIVANNMNTWLESKNYYKRNAAQIAIAIFNGIPRSQKNLTGKLEMTGGMNIARHDAKKLLDQLYNLVNGDLAKLEQVHQMLDPDLYASLGKPPMGAASADVQMLHDNLRDMLDDIHRKNFALGFIDQETYDKYKGTYTPRMYETNEIPDDVQQLLDDQERFNPVTQMETGQFKKRKDLDDLSQKAKDDVLKDPVYSTVKRLMQLDQNAAIASYINQIIANSPSLVKDPKNGDIPEGYQQLNGKGYGKLDGKFVPNYIAEDFKGFFMLNKTFDAFYEAFKKYDKIPFRQFLKKAYTVFDPVVQFGNFTSNVFAFGFSAGIDPVTFASNLSKAHKALKSEGSEFRTLMRSGILNSDVVVIDLIPIKAKMGVSPKDRGVIAKTWNQFDEAAKNLYQYSDNIAKMNAYLIFKDQGFTQQQAIQKVYEGFQNYATVGKMWDIISKVPLFGPVFVKFQADLLRIMKNNVTKAPLTTAMYYASLKFMNEFMVFAGISDEEDDDKKELRTKRDFIPKIPLGFTDIPLVYKTKFGEVNLARFISPFYVFDTGDASSSFNLIKKLSPIGFINKEEVGKGNESMSPMLADPFLGTLAAAAFSDTDFRGKSIKDPESTRYRGSGATVGEEIINKATYLGRSWIPQGSKIHDFYLSQKYGEDFYGRTRTTSQSLLNMVVKVQDWKDGDYKKTALKELDVRFSKIKVLSDESKNIQANFSKKVLDANQDYYDKRITKEQYNRRIEKFQIALDSRNENNLNKVTEEGKKLNEFILKYGKFLK